MTPGWQVVAFPVILPWREEFWTLPLYFPDLRVGVTWGWPGSLPYRGLPLPPEAEAPAGETQGLRPGELRQWQAYKEYRQAQEEGQDDLIQAIRSYGAAAQAVEPDIGLAWRLAWRLEKMQADQEIRLIRVDQNQNWLAEILAPEPWEEQPSFRPAPGIGEMVDPELARLRYSLWERTMAPFLKERWTPFLLGRTARAVFLSLQGWPEWSGPRTERLALPGCKSETDWHRVRDESALARCLPEFAGLLAQALTRTKESSDPAAALAEVREFVARIITPGWPLASAWTWDLEVWAPEPDEEEARPVLCWAGVEGGVPG